MKKTGFLVILSAAGFSILIPILILPLWSVAGRWPWPDILPGAFSLRGLKELAASNTGLLSLLLSSTVLSVTVAILAAVIGLMTARALVFHDFKGKHLVSFAALLPLMVPGTAFALGIQVVFVYLGLGDTFWGVALVHLIYALPYTVGIMTDMTAALGPEPEQQGLMLGASPFRAFYYITMPLLMPGMISSASMAFIISFSQYFLTLMIGGGRVKTLSVVMVPFIQSGDRTLAASYALVFVAWSLLVFILLELLLKKYKNRLTEIG